MGWGQQARQALFVLPGTLALVHLQEALMDLVVSASGDDALDLRVVGQVAHGVLNVCAHAMARDISSATRGNLNLNM